MSFSALSPLVFGLGLAVLAGVLYLLQRLRVRHRELEVVTTLFWHEAVHETRARVLVQRFRHPWAYALVLAICALLWAAIAEPRPSAGSGREHVALLDTSAGMGRGARFERARESLLVWAARLPRSKRTVIASGARRRTLLLPGEEIALLGERLAGFEPEAAPSSIAAELELLARTAPGSISVAVFGGAGLDERFAASLPAGLEVRFVGDDGALAGEARNVGICALGASPASSGAWDAVDVFVELRGAAADAAPGLAAELDGSREGLISELQATGDGAWRYLFRDLPAAGGLLRVQLEGGDVLVLDDAATLRLPDRPRLRVQVEPAWLDILAPALENDPAVVLVSADPDLVVGDVGGAQVPALRFVPAASQAEAFLATYDDERPAPLVLHEALGSLGLADIDSAGLAERADAPIALGVRAGARREITVWSELLGEGFDFRDSRAFPLFVARAMRWLADTEPVTPWVAAGEELALHTSLQDESGARLDALGLAIAPPVAGGYTSAGGAVLHASLLAPGSTLAPIHATTSLAELEAPAGERDLVTWLLLLALALLVGEWALVRTERMP